MMSNDHAFMILGAQNSITTQIEKKMRDKMTGSIWRTTSVKIGPDEYRLVIYKGKKKLVFRFTRDELIEDYGSTKWKTRLLTRVKEIIRGIQR